MKIGIVTVLFKSDDVIDGFIESMNAQTLRDFEVFFVENDVENTFCEQRIRESANFPFEFVRNDTNAGVARGNNQGIDWCMSRDDITHIHFLNNDIEVEPSFLQQHMDFFAANPDMEGLAPKMFYWNSGGKIWFAGGAINYFKEGPRHWGHNKRDKMVGKPLFKIDYTPTCSLLMKKDVLVKSGIRMWEQLFVYYDDYVFCKELRDYGFNLYYTPDIHLQHKVSTCTGGNESDFSRYYNTRNHLYVMRRYKNLMLPLWWLFYKIKGGDIEHKAMRDAFSMS